MITPEGQKLARHWSKYGQETLDSYLIQEVEHPSINPQSVLMRAFVVDRLFPGKFVEIIEQELFYSACACHALQAHRAGRLPELLAAVRGTEADAELPEFLRRRSRAERCQRFDVEQLLSELTECISTDFERFRSPFQDAWKQQLPKPLPVAPRMLELGCGSANDYRFWDTYGIAAHVDYVGVDVCEANIRNAKSRYPDVLFVTGDACCLDDLDSSFDVVFAFDLLEHLSPQGLDAALTEMERLGRDEIWLSLFNATVAAAHEFQEVGDYHWNTLSLSQISRHLRKAGYMPDVISVSEQLQQRFADYRHYNRNAHIVVGRQDARA